MRVSKKLVVSFISALLAATFSTVTPASADESFTCQDSSYTVSSEGVVSDLYYCTGNLVLPSSAKSISPYSSASQITSITLPSGFTDVETLINSYQMEKLTSINVADSNPNFRSVDGVLYNKDLTTLLRVPSGRTGSFSTLPQTRKIGGSGFYFTKLEELTLNNPVDSVENFSFASMSSLKKLSIPATLVQLPEAAFSYFPSLTSILVDSQNPTFTTLDGMLVSKDKKDLYLYPGGREEDTCVIPEGITTLMRSSMNSTKCSSVTFPNTLTEIKIGVFYYSAIKVLEIPNNVVVVDEYAFSNMTSLNRIIVSDSHPTLSTVDGVLFNKSKSSLIEYPQANPRTEYEIPASMISGATKLSFASKLVNLTVAEGNTAYKSVSGVVLNAEGNTLEAYPKGRTDDFYILPKGVLKIMDGSIYTGIVKLVITLDNPAAVDTTTSGIYVYDLESGIEALSNYYRSYRNLTEIDIDLLRGEIKYLSQLNTNNELISIRLNSFINGSASFTKNKVYKCSGGTFEVDLSNTLTSVQGCTGELELPADLIGISQYAFSTENKVSKIIIGANLSNIPDFALYGSNSLNSFSVSTDNNYFSTVDGVLFSKDKTKLVAYPAAKEVASYTVPKTTTSIQKYAFESALVKTLVLSPQMTNLDTLTSAPSSIESIQINANMKEISDYAFEGLSNIKEIKVSAGNPYFESIDGVLFNQDKTVLLNYPRAKSGSEYTVPQGVKVVGAWSFSKSRITKVNFPSTLTEISFYAFFDSTLTDLVIPSSVITLDALSFPRSPTIKSISISGANSELTVIDNVLFTKNKETLLYYPLGLPATKYSIPEGTKSVSYGNFEGSALKELTIPESIDSMSNVLGYGSQIEKLNLPASIKEINSDIFWSDKLKEITLPSANKYYTVLDGILYNKEKTKLIGIPGGNSITSLEIQDGVKEISEVALSGAAIESISIPASVTSDISASLRYLPKLKEFKVDAANPNYKSVDGVLYNKDMTKFLIYPDNKAGAEYVMPSSVKSIAANFYFFNQNLKSITLSTNLESISKYQLIYAAALETVIYDGTNSVISSDIVADTVNFTSTAKIAAKKAADLAAQKVLDDAANAVAAKVKAEADARAALEAKATSEAATKAALEKQAAAEAAAKAAADLQTASENSLKAEIEKHNSTKQALAEAQAEILRLQSEVNKYKPTTIQCVKGKTVKKVTAVNPKCPAGYKKK